MDNIKKQSIKKQPTPAVDVTYFIKVNANGGPTGRLRLETKVSGGVVVTEHEISDTQLANITFDRSACPKVEGWIVGANTSVVGVTEKLEWTGNTSTSRRVGTNGDLFHYVIFFCDQATAATTGTKEKAPSNVSFTLKKKNTDF